MLGCLAKIRPLDVLSGARVDVRVSTFGKRDGSVANGTDGVVWEPSIIQAPSIGLTLWNGDFTDSIEPAGATLPINLESLRNTFPNAAGYMWMGAPIEIYAGEPGSIDTSAPIFRGVVKGYGGAGVRQTLQCEVDTEPFNANVLTQVYAGSGGAEGGEDLKNRVKPIVLGHARNVEPLLINAVDNVYQFSAYGPIEAVDALYERGSSFGASVGDFANYPALVAATIAEGRWATCLAQGMIRLGAPAAGVITGDLRGHRVGGNLLRWSEQFDNAVWGKSNLQPVAVDSVTAPDGTATADKLIATTANVEHYAEQTIPVSSNQTYTLSLYVKPDSGIANFSFGVIHVGDLSAQTTRWRISNSGGTLSDGGTVGSLALRRSLIPLSSGWWRIAFRYTLSGTITSHRLRIYAIGGTIPADTVEPGDGTSGIAVWGAQARVGALPGRYTKTENAASGPVSPRFTGEFVSALADMALLDQDRIDIGSLTALDVDKPYPINLALTDQTSFIDIAQRLIRPCNWTAGVSLTGSFFAADVDMSGSEAITFDAQGKSLPIVVASEEQDVSPPYFRTIMGAARSWRVHTDDEIAWNAELNYRGLHSLTETYREGDWVDDDDGSTWLYINATPSMGNALPVWPATSNTWWDNLSPPKASVPPWVLDAATNFNTDNDQNGLTPPGVTSLSLTSAQQLDGSASLTINFGYTNSTVATAANNIDGFLVFLYPQNNSASWTYSPTATMELRVLEPGQRSVTILGQPVEKYSWAAVIPFRRVGSNITASTLITGPVVQTPAASGHRPAPAPNYQGNLAGVIASLIATATTNFNADNDANPLTPPAATGLSLTSLKYPDSTCAVTLNWNYTHSTTPGASNNIDGFLFGLFQRVSGASWTYTGSEIIDWRWVNPNVRSFTFNAKPVNLNYWGLVIPYRRVRSDVAPNGFIEGAIAQTTASSPHNPGTSPIFTGSIDFLQASLVAIGANRAQNAIDASNNIAANKVLQASIISGALNETTYLSQASTIAFAVNDDATPIMTTSGIFVDSSGRLIARFIPTFYIQKIGPVQGETYSIEFEIVLFPAGSGTPAYASHKYVWKERWDGPSSAGVVNLEQRPGVIEHYFTGITPGNYGIGARITTPATNGAVMPPYRYMNARAPRADE